MTSFRLTVLISGEGTNLQAILDACSAGTIDARVTHVVCNKRRARGLARVAFYNTTSDLPITTSVLTYNPAKEERGVYDSRLAQRINAVPHDLVVLAGFAHIISALCLRRISTPIINLHPALPKMFPGLHAVKRAFEAFHRGEIAFTGVMVHRVIVEVDAGEVVASRKFPINAADTLETLSERVSVVEKWVLLEAIATLLHK